MSTIQVVPTEPTTAIIDALRHIVRMSAWGDPILRSHWTDLLAVAAEPELGEALDCWYRAEHHGTSEDRALQSELLAIEVGKLRDREEVT